MTILGRDGRGLSDEAPLQEFIFTQDILAREIVASVREPMLVLDADLRVVVASSAFCQRFEATEEATLGHPVYALGNGQWDSPRLHALLNDVAAKGQVFDDYEIDHDFTDNRPAGDATQRCAHGAQGFGRLIS